MPNALELVGRGLLPEMISAFRDFAKGDCGAASGIHTSGRDEEDDCARHARSGFQNLVDGHIERGQASFEAAMEIDPNDVRSLIGMACALDQQGETREAATRLETALQREPANAAALLALGFCRERFGETWSAEEAYRAAVAADPKMRNAHERLAAIYLIRGAVDDAIKHHTVVRAGAPGEVGPLLTLAHLYAQVGRHTEAVAAYQRVLALDSENGEASNDLISACVDAGRIEEGIAHLEDVVRGSGGCVGDHLRLGELHERLGQEEHAIQAYVRAAELDPNSIEAAVRLGTLHLRRGRNPEAESWFVRAIGLNDRAIESLVGLGIAQEALGRHQDALATFDTVADVEPNSTQLFAEMARLHLSAEAAREVDRYLSPRDLADPIGNGTRDCSVLTDQIEILRDAMRLRPNHADMHYRLGLLLRQAGDSEGAIDAYRRAVAINPDYLDAQLKLGIALHETGDCDSAIECFRRALSVDPDAVRLHYELGLIYADRAMWDRAVDHFEQAADSQSGNVEFRAHLALGLQNMGLVERAEACWQSLRDITPLDDAGQSLLEGGRRCAGLAADS